MDLGQASLTPRLDAQDNLLHALSITQSEHGHQLRRHTEILNRHSEALERVEAGIRDILTLLQNGGPAGGQGKLGG